MTLLPSSGRLCETQQLPINSVGSRRSNQGERKLQPGHVTRLSKVHIHTSIHVYTNTKGQFCFEFTSHVSYVCFWDEEPRREEPESQLKCVIMGNVDSGGKVAKVFLLCHKVDVFCSWYSPIQSVVFAQRNSQRGCLQFSSTPAEGGLTMATLKSEVNTSRLKRRHNHFESLCDNGIGPFAISLRSRQQLPGVQEVRVRHCWSEATFGTKSMEQTHFEVKGVMPGIRSRFDGAVRQTSHEFPIERDKKVLPIFFEIPRDYKVREVATG